MADESGISWTDATFNPWIGCAKVSPACAHCYAETFSENRMGLHVWGEDAARRITADSTWKKPVRWAKLAREGFLPNGKENLDGHRPRVFCASMADVFEERPDLEAPRDRLFNLIEETPELDWLLLTKRPEFMRDWLFEHNAWDIAYPANVWLGVSIENVRWTWRADVLREIAAECPKVPLFISAEPLLGSLFEGGLPDRPSADLVAAGDKRLVREGRASILADRAVRGGNREPLNLDGISWVIVGGESGGRSARPMRIEWARQLLYACRERGIAFHFKQWGSHDADGVYRGPAPKAAGKALDGVEYCEFPDTSAAVLA